MGLFGFESKREREAREAKEYAARMAQIAAKDRAELEERRKKTSEYKLAFDAVMQEYRSEKIALRQARIQMLELINKMKQIPGRYSEVQKMMNQLQKFENEIKRECRPVDGMILTESYGQINEALFNSIKKLLDGEDIEAIRHRMILVLQFRLWEIAIKTNNQNIIFQIDPALVMKYLWLSALKKPYSTREFERIKQIFYLKRNTEGEECSLYHYNFFYNNEVLVAELYSAIQMGSQSVVRSKINEYLDSFGKTFRVTQLMTIQLTTLASGLMWMKAYDEEKLILEFMLSHGITMPPKLQERLHALSNNGGDAPESADVESSSDMLYFDISALKWDDNDFQGFFENLAFQEKSLEYSLAVRDKNEMLTRGIGLTMPDDAKILERIQAVFEEEFGSSAYAKSMTCVAISNGNRENLNGILVQTTECEHLGILLCMVPIGKKLNIKFYTLYMPISGSLEEQKQKVLSLRGELSPSASLWESSLKETILIAIQQLLNDAATSKPSGAAAASSETVEF